MTDKTMRRLAELAIEAKRIMSEKGSYEPTATDPRVRVEYERAYAFIQKMSLYAPVKPEPRVVEGEVLFSHDAASKSSTQENK